METWRTFVAIEMDASLKRELRRVQQELQEQVPPRSVRWVQADGFHLTLKFLGGTPLETVEAVKVALSQAAGQVDPFRVTVGGLGCFPSPRQPRVVWVGLEEMTGALARLQKAVEMHVAPLGFPAEKRPFSPHLTLGRVQQNASRSAVRQIGDVVAASAVGTLGEVAAAAVSYIKSDLRPSGAVYTTLYDAKLGRG